MPRTDRRDRNDWLDLLVHVEEPFLAPPVANAVFPDGPTRTDKDVRDAIRDRVDATVTPDGTVRADADPAGFARWFLTDVLGHHAGGPTQTVQLDTDRTVEFTAQGQHVTLEPTFVAHDPGEPDTVRMLVFAEPGMVLPDDPNDYLPGKRHKQQGWTASPVHRATRAARTLGARLALITNGRFWTLVGVSEQTVGYGTWDASLFHPEPRLLDSLIQVLRASRMYGPDDERPERLLDRSIDAQQTVTKNLGKSIRKAAELLVSAFSRANRRNEYRLLEHVPDERVYEATVTVLMRLVFLLYAEENGLLRLDNPLYRDHYAASSLLDDLFDRSRGGQGAMQYHTDAWHRILAVSRAVHGGTSANDLTIAEYGGSLFDPDRFPFLEGRIVGPDGDEIDAVRPDLVDDLTVLEILRAITVVKGRRVSFRALEVEQIGTVYESLLDHSTFRADSTVLGLDGKDGEEPEMPLAKLEEQLDKGTKKFSKWYSKQDGITLTPAKVRDALDDETREQVQRGLLAACGGDQDLHERVRPFANLLRTDLRGLPMVMLEDDLYVTETSIKSDRGTAYTTPELAREIVQHALDPLIHSPGPQDTRDEDEWVLKSSDEILQLKVCDPAIGSAAIAVAAVRYLAEHLVEARHREGLIIEEQLVSAEADQSALDVHVQARRDVVAHCIYGVDMDPMAVEMAKMSLWLVTLSKDRPFTFLDHAIKCGNSLLGITNLRQLRSVQLAPEPGTQTALAVDTGFEDPNAAHDYFAAIDRAIAEATALRRQLRDSDVADPTEAAMKTKLHTEVENLTRRLQVAADAIAAACLSTADGSQSDLNRRLGRIPPLLGDLSNDDSFKELRELATEWREEHNPDPDSPREFFHWPLEFPEVFDDGGRFDAMVGNPPFLGGSKITAPHGTDFREHLVKYIADGDRGQCDLVGYFFRRASTLSKSLGFLATNTIHQGATHDVALRPLASSSTIHRAYTNRPWPGEPAVHVALVWLTDLPWQGSRILDDVPVDEIESDLYPAASVRGEPFSLPDHTDTVSEGFKTRGSGFRLTPEQAQRMIAADPSNAEVVKPYAGGEINSDPRQEPSRGAIFFREMAQEEAAKYELPFQHVHEHVKPEREKLSNDTLREQWWLYERSRPRLLEQLKDLEHVIVLTVTSTYAIPVRASADVLYSNSVAVFPYDDWGVYGLLSSTPHWIWLQRYGSTLETRIRYTASTVFETFPFPSETREIANEMRELHEWRSQLMVDLDVGLTDLYGRYHDPQDESTDVGELRARHRALDHAVRNAYQWIDLELNHGHHETRYGVFYTASRQARYELLQRLLDLNFRQYAEQTGRSYESVVQEARSHG